MVCRVVAAARVEPMEAPTVEVAAKARPVVGLLADPTVLAMMAVVEQPAVVAVVEQPAVVAAMGV